ncbi:hypothetical protein BLNAU_25116 [Blattamonas nauphoetae]|uniref:Uncharacterized protein n=1 Tax=Blattamonas nauphoetae TaxID=2049346 RepID=A0ABQ9WKI9_9EUKA|nr:hypothetical protein BLNAU_25116 [Blattamonas nauphoetae]
MFTSSIFEPDFELYDEQNQYLFDEPDLKEMNQSGFLTNYDDLQLSLSDSSDEQDDAPSFDTWPDSPSPPQAHFQEYVNTPEQGPNHPPCPKNNFSVKYMIFPNGLCLTLNQSTSWLKIFKGDSSLNIQVETAMTAVTPRPKIADSTLPLRCRTEQHQVECRHSERKGSVRKVASCSHFEFTPLKPRKGAGHARQRTVLDEVWGCRFNSNKNTSLMKEIARQTRMDCFTNKVHHFWLVIVITLNKLCTLTDNLTSPYSQSSQEHHRNLNSIVSNELSITRQAPSPSSLSLDGVYEVSEMLLSNTEMTLIGSPSCQFIASDTSANSPHLFRLTNTTLSIRNIKFDMANDLSCTSNVEHQTQTHQPSIASLSGSTLSTDNCSTASIHFQAIQSPFVGNTLSSLQVHSNTGFLFANTNEHSPQICSTISDTFLANISRTDMASLPSGLSNFHHRASREVAHRRRAGHLRWIPVCPLESQHAFSCLNTSFTQCINSDTHQHNPSNYTFVGQTYDAKSSSFHRMHCHSHQPNRKLHFLNLKDNEDDVTIRSCSFTANVTSSFYARFLQVIPLAGTFPTLTIEDITCLYGIADTTVNTHNVIYIASSLNLVVSGSRFSSPNERLNARSILIVSGTYIFHLSGCVFSDANVNGSGGASAVTEDVYTLADSASRYIEAFSKHNSLQTREGGAITGASLTMPVFEDCHFEGNTATEGRHYSGNDIITQSGSTVFLMSYYYSAALNGLVSQEDIFLPHPDTKTDYEHKLSVAVDGSGSTCSEALPCQTVEAALPENQRNWKESSSDWDRNIQRRNTDCFEVGGAGWEWDAVVSGGMKVGSGGNLTLRSMTLLPSTATTIVVGMSEESVLRLSFIRIDEISSHSSSLISISKGTTTLFRCWFDKVNLTSSAFVSVSGSASLSVLGTYFMLITRTNGEGASCIDSESSGQLNFDNTDFGNCSSSGVAGALHLKGSTTSASLTFKLVYFYNNEAKTESTANDETTLKVHDMVVEGFSSNRISTSTVNSFSPQISYLRLGVPTHLSPVNSYGYAANGISFPLAGKYYQGVPLVQFSSIKEMTEQTYKYCELVNPLMIGLTLPVEPLFAEDVQVRWRAGKTVASVSDQTIITVDNNTNLQFTEGTFVFNAIPTVTPFVIQQSSGQFLLQNEIIQMNCTVTTLTLPLFLISAGSVRLDQVTLPILSFDGCAMFEGTGGTIRLDKTKFPQITSTANGSVVHATSTIVISDSSLFDRCTSMNGGAIWFEATGTKYLQVTHPKTSTFPTTFEGCEAAERGGAICVEGSSSISNPIRFFSDAVNHARFSGNQATVSGNDVFVGKNVFGSKKISEIGSFGGGSLSDWFHVVIEDLGKTEEEKVDIGLLIPLPTVSVNGSVNELTTGMSGKDSEECKWTSTFCATLGYAMNSLRSKQDGKDIEMKTQFVWNMTYTELPMKVSDQNVKLTGTTASDQKKCNVTRTIVEMDSKSTAGSALFTIEKGAISPANWEGHSQKPHLWTRFGEKIRHCRRLQGGMKRLSFYLFRPVGKIVAGGTGNNASTHPFCGSEQLICSTLESAHTSLRDGLDTVWIESDISLISKLEVVRSATLTSSTSTKRVVSLTKSGMVEVDGNGITVTMKSLTVCFDSSSISPTLFSVKCGTLDVDECVIGGSSSENALVLSSSVASLISVGQAGAVDLCSSKISNVVFAHSSEGVLLLWKREDRWWWTLLRSHLLMFGDNFASIAASAEMKKLKPEIPETGFFSLEERKKLAGSVDGVVESILYECGYERESGVVHVRKEGVDAVKELVSGGKIVIDSAFSLAEGLVQPNSEITLCTNTQKNEEIGVEVLDLGSFSISQGHLTVSSVSFSTAVKAGPFMTVSAAGSLSITSCSFSGFSSPSSGSVVSASLGEANALSITSSQFSNCKSDLSGGVIHLLLSSVTKSSQIVMKEHSQNVRVGMERRDWVFVEGTNLKNQIDAQNWSGHPSLLEKKTRIGCGGTDSSESSPIFSSSTLLVYLVETTLDEVFVSSLGRDVRGCGLARLPCKTITSSTSHLLNSTTSQVTLLDASTLSEEVVNSWNHLIVCGDEQSSKNVLVSLSFHSSSSGSIVCGTVSSSSFLSLTESSFSSCKSDGDGGVIWVRCEESVGSSSLVVNCSFDSSCGCGSGCRGSGCLWKGLIRRFDLRFQLGKDIVIALLPNPRLSPVWKFRASTIFVGSNGRDSNGCGHSERLCKRLERGHDHLKGTMSLKLFVVETVSLTAVVTFAPNNLVVTSQIGRGTVNVEGKEFPRWGSDRDSHSDGEPALLQSGCCDMLDAVHNWSWTTDSDIVFFREVGCV